ncbi:MAG: ornithine cyclodeaminase, partial [Chloroflexota bacterium]|nr:ornithine cyclodeaminase [Chloroflexota bacterium]
MSSERILYLSRRDVELACAEIDPVATVAAALALHASGHTVLPDEAYLGWTTSAGDSARSLNMPSWLGGEFASAGTKIINGNPGNPGRRRARASGLTLLFDTLSARVISVMDAAYISSLRTASVTALGVSVLQPAPVECVCVLGAGALAEAHLGLLPVRLPRLREVRLFDIEADRAAALHARFAPLMDARGVRFHLASSAEHAVREAQLI